MNTRALQGGVASRIASESVILTYEIGVPQADGSETITYKHVPCKASVAPLQAKDYERLEIGGIIVKDGVTIVIPFVTNRPDSITYLESKYRVVNWAPDTGVTICTGDKITVEGA